MAIELKVEALDYHELDISEKMDRQLREACEYFGLSVPEFDGADLIDNIEKDNWVICKKIKRGHEIILDPRQMPQETVVKIILIERKD